MEQREKENSEAVWELPTELSSNNIMETNIGKVKRN